MNRMRRKRWPHSVIGVALVLVAGACGGGEEPSTEPSGPQGETFKIALLLPAAKNDLSWNQAAYTGLQSMKSANVEVAFTESVGFTTQEAYPVARQYAERGFNLIIGHNSQYKDAIFELGQQFPDLNFAYANSGLEETADNVAGYDFRQYEGAYLMGILAGALSESGKLGGIGGIAFPNGNSLFHSFLDGARSVNPNATLTVVFTGDFADVARAKSSAEALADRGIDFFAPFGDGPARGAIEVAAERGLYATGYLFDMSSLAPENVVGSIIWNAGEEYSQLLEDIDNGTFRPGQSYLGGIAEGVVDIAINPALMDQIPAAILQEIERVKTEVENGTFTIPYKPEEFPTS